ncbi:MAG: hypothetical protein WBB00_25160 [Mycobacterium sp.]
MSGRITDVSDSNPTGITDYDIHEWAKQPEWQQITQLINRMALRSSEDQSVAVPARYRRRGQDFLAQSLSHLARGIGYMDCCQQCGRATGWMSDTATAPYRVEVSDGKWLHGTYRCAAGHEWTCGYALAFGAFTC